MVCLRRKGVNAVFSERKLLITNLRALEGCLRRVFKKCVDIFVAAGLPIVFEIL